MGNKCDLGGKVSKADVNRWLQQRGYKNMTNGIYGIHRFDHGLNVNKQKSLESINEMNSLDENIDINHEHEALKMCKICNKSFDVHLVDEKVCI